MALGSAEAVALDLRACYGDDKSAIWPDAIWLALFNGNPYTSGVELDNTVGGYQRLSIANVSANVGTPFIDTTTSAPVTMANATAYVMATSTGAYSATANYWAYMSDDVPDGFLLDYGPLTTTVTITGSGQAAVFPIGSIILSSSDAIS